MTDSTTTTATATATGLVLAIDLGKFKSVACVLDAAARRHTFVTVDTTPAALHDLLAAHAGTDPSRGLVAVETCDAAGWVHDLAAALGLGVVVALPE